MRKRGEDMKTIFKNGRIHTMNGGEIVDSISVEDGRIVSDDYVPEDGRIREVDLCKKTVIPAFHDSHQHFLCYATDKEKINFFDAKSLADMEYLTKKYMKEKDIKKGQWIQGGGWNENNFEDPILPTRRDLDKFCPDNPAIFTRACCSVAVANTLALKEAGIFENPPQMDDGLIVTDEDGVPTGMLNERARFLIYDILTKYSKDELKGFILDYQKDLLKVGLTTVQTDDFKLWDASIKDILDAYRELDKEGKLKVRFIQQLRLINMQELNYYLADGNVTGEGSEFFKIGAFKLLPDGSLGFRIIHCQITGEDTLDRFARDHVLADIQPLFIRADMEVAEELIGKERLSTSYNWKTMLEKGIHVSGSSDAPVESFDPMLAIHCAVTSTNLQGEPEGGWMPDQRLTVQEAVELYTTGSAYTAYEEEYKGKLKEGYLADFIVLSDDIFSIDEKEILSVKVEKTFLGGEEVYSC